MRHQKNEWNEFNAHLHVNEDDVVLNQIKPVSEVAFGNNKLKIINKNKGSERHGNIPHEL